MLVLSRAEVEQVLDVDVMLAGLERAFTDLSAGRASVPPRIAAVCEPGLLAAMPGYLPGVLAVKLVSVFARNHDFGKPSHQALIAIFDELDGTPLAVLDGGYITAMRTGGASAVSVRALARPGAGVLAVVGAGVQGRSHLQTVARVREFSEIRVASRNPDHAAALVLDFPGAVVAESFEAAVSGADVVCLCTDSAEPVLPLEWLSPGCHVTSVGFGLEVGADLVRGTSVFVEWRGAAALPPPAGARELQGLDPASVTELGEVLSGARPGRRSEAEITLYKSTGHAVEDAVTAREVFERAVGRGLGREVPL